MFGFNGNVGAHSTDRSTATLITGLITEGKPFCRQSGPGSLQTCWLTTSFCAKSNSIAAVGSVGSRKGPLHLLRRTNMTRGRTSMIRRKRDGYLRGVTVSCGGPEMRRGSTSCITGDTRPTYLIIVQSLQLSD